MFIPNVTTEKFDRNIFTSNTVNDINIKFAPDTPMLFYYKSSAVVGYVSGKHTVKAYPKFFKNGFMPISLVHENKEYCGWISEDNLIQ